MKSRVFTLALLSAVLTTGCVTPKALRSTGWPFPANERVCKETNCSPEEARQAFNKANAFCRDVHNAYAGGQSGIAYSRVALATIGAVAGNVITPMVTGAAKDAWSGVAGSSSALQGSMDQAFSESMLVKRRNMIAEVASASYHLHVRADDSDDQVMSAIDLARACSMASAQADQQMLQKILQD